MGIGKPFRRTARIFTDDTYFKGGKWKYILHDSYAQNSASFIRSFLLIQKDTRELFDFIKASDQNLCAYSYRIHELLVRACIEIEAIFTAILRENNYQRNDKKNWTVEDYKKIEQSHFLSRFAVKITDWDGNCGKRMPFRAWCQDRSLNWCQAYNRTKHDRHRNFREANFENLVDAVCGLAAVLASQF